MPPKNPRPSLWPFLLVATICVLLAAILLPATLLPAQAKTAVGDLPPRFTDTPTPTATPQPTSTPYPTPRPRLSGGQIDLHVQFPPTWPWDSVHWQDVWTVVQWQDTWGNWHDVEGWQGTLDKVVSTESGNDGDVVGQKTWWVAESDLGKGPFRWTVYQSEGGQLIGASEPFQLPDFNGGVTAVTVSPTL